MKTKQQIVEKMSELREMENTDIEQRILHNILVPLFFTDIDSPLFPSETQLIIHIRNQRNELPEKGKEILDWVLN